ncbi:DUF805 domain-containing protein [Polaribacter sp. Hel1_85]|uniref:DUF805 domain-containing protein n=1 Tax=Polaribacter sp. Hel1_85 TaxID=1250005 RepID=UPI00052C2414|nr:DUF805 domain-containing protein [Polaribacter sp. Hel1_85]KGL63489.1 hypothetical protein PHEL85_0525 [Polaribacter sp. Hel1_85]
MNWYLKVLRDHYLDFKGRARRQEFWMFTLINIIISYSFTGLEWATGSTIFSMLSLIYSLLVLIPGLGVSVRRLHDVGKSGWYYLLIFIPIIGWIWLIVLFAMEGESRPNEWGENPKGIGNDSAINQIGRE